MKRSNGGTLGASRSFEQQVHRIQELLFSSDACVTWNDRILDPDSPGRTRQIDVTVRRGRHLTLIECRTRKNPQDVTWIEELIGRRQSLGADAVVAVSATGFTAGAVHKASAHSIALRDLRALTDDEIANWGRSIALKLYFFQYSGITLSLGFAVTDARAIEPAALKASLAGHPALATLFNQAARVVGKRLIPATMDQNLSVDFGIVGTFEDVTVGGKRLYEARMEGSARLLLQQVRCPVVSAYGVLPASNSDREAIVQKFELGDTSIVHKNDRISLHLDLASVKTPPLGQFQYVATEGDKEVDFEIFSLTGLEQLNVREGTISLTVFGIPDGLSTGS